MLSYVSQIIRRCYNWQSPHLKVEEPYNYMLTVVVFWILEVIAFFLLSSLELFMKSPIISSGIEVYQSI